MLLYTERQTIVTYGQKLITSGLTTGSGGNLSIYNRQEDLVAIKPTGIDYFQLTPEDIVVVTIDGKIVDGTREPSSEIALHLGLLKHRLDVNAVVHTHSVYAATIACLNWELPAVHYMVGFSGNKVPLAPYETYGTQELAENVIRSIGRYNACLMANHGIITIANNLPTAFAAAEEIELVARIYYQAKCIGEPIILSDAEMANVVEKFKTYGQKS
jgi:L-fuculose-phosphate aldolase